jgi:transcriptional regulator with XRE-family HTH domain
LTHLDQEGEVPGSEWRVDWGRLLRIARQVAGLSLTELGLATGLSKGHLSKLESGHPTAANPSRATLAALARALPSFRPLANTLEPSAALGSLVFGNEATAMKETTEHVEPDAQRSPLRLGWRELEIVMALLALEGSASPVALTTVLLARAVGRSAADLRPTLAHLVATGVLDAHAPSFNGAQATYRKSPEFEERTGIVRIGDALVLAAGLLAQVPAGRREPPVRSGRDLREA